MARDREVSDRVRFVVKYDPRLPDIRSILKGAWSVMTEDREMKEIFKGPPMVCYQKVKSLGEMLVRAKLPARGATGRPKRGQGDGFKPCRQSKCPVCDLLKDKSPVTSVTCSATGELIKVSGRLTCTSSNLIYCITCRRGGRLCPTHPQYIGETGKQLRERARGHRGTVVQPGQQDTTTPVGVHFRGPGHGICDLEIIPIEKVRQDVLTRKVRESYHIGVFDSVTRGLNLRK